jgi:hypothetical protein
MSARSNRGALLYVEKIGLLMGPVPPHRQPRAQVKGIACILGKSIRRHNQATLVDARRWRNKSSYQVYGDTVELQTFLDINAAIGS